MLRYFCDKHITLCPCTVDALHCGYLHAQRSALEQLQVLFGIVELLLFLLLILVEEKRRRLVRIVPNGLHARQGARRGFFVSRRLF